MAVALCACGKKSDPPSQEDAPKNESTTETDVSDEQPGEVIEDDNTVAEQPEVSATPEPTEDPHKGKVQSKLTGKYISPKKANKRPYACMTITSSMQPSSKAECHMPQFFMKQRLRAV